MSEDQMGALAIASRLEVCVAQSRSPNALTLEAHCVVKELRRQAALINELKVKLFAAPQPQGSVRQPLTNEQIFNALVAAGVAELQGDFVGDLDIEIARAIEAAHGITAKPPEQQAKAAEGGAG